MEIFSARGRVVSVIAIFQQLSRTTSEKLSSEMVSNTHCEQICCRYRLRRVDGRAPCQLQPSVGLPSEEGRAR
jgi:hypothetical protein